MSDYVQGDLGVAYKATCRRGTDESPIDLTGCTVTLCFRINDGPLKRRQMTIETPATAGNVTYTFVETDLNVSGIMSVEVEITKILSGILVTNNVNDKLEFEIVNPQTIYTADITPGTYNEASICAAIETAMSAATLGNPTYDWTYNVGTGLFTCLQITGPASGTRLRFGSGETWFAESIHPYLGFLDANTGLALSHTSSIPKTFSTLLMTSKDPKQYTVRPRV